MFSSAVIVDVVVLVTVLLVFGFLLASDHHVAGATPQESTEGLGFIRGGLVRSTTICKYHLHLIKQLLSDDWLVMTFVCFTQVSKVSIIEGVVEDKIDSVFVESLASTSN